MVNDWHFIKFIFGYITLMYFGMKIPVKLEISILQVVLSQVKVED